MNTKHLESIIRFKICPVCSTAMMRETKHNIFQCCSLWCGELFDLSHLSDDMINALLAKEIERKT